ncbi:MAG: hypothetical protein RL273_472 [Bacteroidota bacterium]|jgi:hypothetical protein
MEKFKKLEKALKKEQEKLNSWIFEGNCEDASTEEYLIGRIDGLKLAIKLVKVET